MVISFIVYFKLELKCRINVWNVWMILELRDKFFKGNIVEMVRLLIVFSVMVKIMSIIIVSG